jgi:regulator of protease activity HflC (stomatin/prohibitin superfamily)
MVIAVILIVLGVMAATALVLAGASVRVLREYERGIVFRLGRVIDQKGPGLVLLIPAVDRMVRVSLRTVTLRIPPQEVITRDNVPVRVAAVAYFRVIDPTRSVLEVEDFMGATLQIAQTTLRSVLGKAELDALLAERERLNEHLQQIIDEQTEPWGIKVTIVEIKDVEIPDRMQHALARQAEAERNRRAKVINAEGEYQAADRLADAADVIRPNPVTLQLRYLQALSDISSNQGSTIVFPMPIDLIRPMLEPSGEGEGEARQKRRRAERAETPAAELGEGAGAAELREGASAAKIGEGASAAEIGEGASAAEIGEGAGAAEVGGGPPDSELGDGAPGAEAPPPQPRV